MAEFEGHRPGYYFGTVQGTTGYHVDRGDGGSGPGGGVPAAISPQGRKRERERERASGQGSGRGQGVDLDLVSAGRQNHPSLDSHGAVQKALKSLVKKYNRNVNDRLKYGSQPEKFYESEVELAVAVDGLGAGTEGLWLYEGLLKAGNEGVVAPVMGVLQHEDGDIAARMISLLSECVVADAFGFVRLVLDRMVFDRIGALAAYSPSRPLTLDVRSALG